MQSLTRSLISLIRFEIKSGSLSLVTSIRFIKSTTRTPTSLRWRGVIPSPFISRSANKSGMALRIRPLYWDCIIKISKFFCVISPSNLRVCCSRFATILSSMCFRRGKDFFNIFKRESKEGLAVVSSFQAISISCRALIGTSSWLTGRSECFTMELMRCLMLKPLYKENMKRRSNVLVILRALTLKHQTVYLCKKFNCSLYIINNSLKCIQVHGLYDSHLYSSVAIQIPERCEIELVCIIQTLKRCK